MDTEASIINSFLELGKLAARIKSCAAMDPLKDDPFAMMGYVVEEVGECYDAMTLERGVKPDKGEPDEPLESEQVDVIIAALGNYFATCFRKELPSNLQSLNDRIEIKLRKWENRVLQNK